MAKTVKKTKKKVEDIQQIDVDINKVERYLPCEWVIQFDDDEPIVFATADESSPTPEITIKLQNTNHSHITFTDSNTNKKFRFYARPKL